MREMNPGETATVTCSSCDTEFEITLEPKAKGKKKSADLDPKGIVNCPFCTAGADSMESDELSEEGDAGEEE